MIKEAKGFGATVEEAKENAIKNLGAGDFDDVQFDVVLMPKKKMLGIFGGNDAEVRAYIELPDKKDAHRKGEKKKSETKKTETKIAEVKKEEPKRSAPVKPVQKPQHKISASDLQEFGEPVPEALIAADSEAGKAVAYIKTVLKGMNIENIEITVSSKENTSLISLNGDDLSILIGRRGETLDALQYLSGLVANNGGGHYKVSLNIGDYREKREETLVKLANRLAKQALEAGKCRTLEPMNPYERKIIHTAVQNIGGVHSGSFGEGAERRVVIAPEGVELRPRMNRNGDRRDRRGRDRRPQKPSQTVTSVPSREPKRDSDIPLYGKIN